SQAVPSSRPIEIVNKQIYSFSQIVNIPILLFFHRKNSTLFYVRNLLGLHARAWSQAGGHAGQTSNRSVVLTTNIVRKCSSCTTSADTSNMQCTPKAHVL
ncbi:unnamed protein product, partial [Ectocarpus fasciculatus]